MFFSDEKTRALQAQVEELTGQLDDAYESSASWRQKADTAEHRMRQMELHRSPEEIGAIALKLAEEIENVFARGGDGRNGRLNQVSLVVRRGIEIALVGEKNWKT